MGLMAQTLKNITFGVIILDEYLVLCMYTADDKFLKHLKIPIILSVFSADA